MDRVEGENGHGDQQDPTEVNKTQSELLKSLSNALTALFTPPNVKVNIERFIRDYNKQTAPGICIKKNRKLILTFSVRQDDLKYLLDIIDCL